MTPRARSRFSYLLVIWLAFFGGAVAWSAFHLLSYLWVTIACDIWWRVVMNGTTALFGLTSLGLTWMSYRGWRGAERARGDDAAERDERSLAFFTFSGLVMNLIFTVAILMTGAAVWFLNPCA